MGCCYRQGGNKVGRSVFGWLMIRSLFTNTKQRPTAAHAPNSQHSRCLLKHTTCVGRLLITVGRFFRFAGRCLAIKSPFSSTRAEESIGERMHGCEGWCLQHPPLPWPPPWPLAWPPPWPPPWPLACPPPCPPALAPALALVQFVRTNARKQTNKLAKQVHVCLHPLSHVAELAVLSWCVQVRGANGAMPAVVRGGLNLRICWGGGIPGSTSIGTRAVTSPLKNPDEHRKRNRSPTARYSGVRAR